MKPLDIKHILKIVLRQFQAQGFRHVALAVGYVAELIQAYFGDGGKLGLPIDYSFKRTSPWARPAAWPTSS